MSTDILVNAHNLHNFVRKTGTEFNLKIVNSKGFITSANLTKQDIINLTKLNSRDVRLHLPHQPIGISIRDNCILVNMMHIKVIIMSDQILIYDPQRSLEIQQLLQNLRDNLSLSPTCSEKLHIFEFVALDVVLTNICNFIQNHCENFRLQTVPLLLDLLKSPTQKKSIELLPIKNELKKLEVSVKAISNSLSDLLENPLEMEQMYLSQKLNPSFQKPINQDIEEVEDLLESHFCEFAKIGSSVSILQNDIAETDDTVIMMLDISRNRIMIIDLWVNIVTLAFGLGSFISGIFGMNLKNRIETHDWAFPITVISSFICMVIVTLIFGYHYRQSKYSTLNHN